MHWHTKCRFLYRVQKVAYPYYADSLLNSTTRSYAQAHYRVPGPTANPLDTTVNYLESSPSAILQVLNHLEPATRRRLIVAGGALEWFGKEDVEKELTLADQDRDTHISPNEFRLWFSEAVQRNAEDPLTVVPFRVLLLLALQSGLPFVGFGFLDNCLMLVAGEMIDSTLGFYLNTSVMASAAMGNVVSGTVGMQVHGVMDRFFSNLGFGLPPLSRVQLKQKRVFLAGHIGGSIGIALGLTLGMVPLLFMPDSEDKQARKVFTEIDTNHDALASAVELRDAIARIGIATTSEEVNALLDRIHHVVGQRTENENSERSLTEEEFVSLYKSLLRKRHTST